MFCTPGLVFDGTEGVGYCFHILRAQIRFRRYRGRWVPFSTFRRPNMFFTVPKGRIPFSCFACPDSFSAVPRASGHVFMFALSDSFLAVPSATGPVFGRLDSFPTVPRSSGPVFKFCAPRHVFDGTEGVPSRFHVLRSQIRFPRNRGRRVQFPSFALKDSFLAVPRVSGPVFMFCAHGLFFGDTKGVDSEFNVLRVRTHFRRY
jgi:hypothetical protein